MDLKYALEQAKEMKEEVEGLITELEKGNDWMRAGQIVSNMSTTQCRLEWALDNDDQESLGV